MAKKQAEPDRLQLEYRPLGALLRAPRNAKDHDIGVLHGSISRFGYRDPIEIDAGTGTITAGHGRLETLQQKRLNGEPPPRFVVDKDGDWHVPVVISDFESSAEAEAYLIANNRTQEIGGWLDDRLLEQLEIIARDSPAGLAGTGYDDQHLDELRASLGASGAVADRGKTVDEFWDTYKKGAIKQIVLYFDADQYEDAMARIAKIQQAEPELDNHTALFLRLMESYESRKLENS